jgi:hypothetical protein
MRPVYPEIEKFTSAGGAAKAAFGLARARQPGAVEMVTRASSEKRPRSGSFARDTADWLSVAPEADPDRLVRRMQIAAHQGRLPKPATASAPPSALALLRKPDERDGLLTLGHNCPTLGS